jgi:hypothetical protein
MTIDMNKIIKYAGFLLLLIVVSVIYFKNCTHGTDTTNAIRVDTLIVRDTIVVRIPEPIHHYIVRTDTVKLTTLEKDTVLVAVPIEQKEYKTDDYRAVIEGYNPELLELDIYRQTQYINTTETRIVIKNNRWSVGIQGGIGYAGKFTPYIGVGVQYNLFSF